MGNVNPGKFEVIIFTNGVKTFFWKLIYIFDLGDEVIIIEPYFDCYEPMVSMIIVHIIAILISVK